MSNKIQAKNLHNTINIDRIKNLEVSLKNSKDAINHLKNLSEKSDYPGFLMAKAIISKSYDIRLKELKKTKKNLTIC